MRTESANISGGKGGGGGGESKIDPYHTLELDIFVLTDSLPNVMHDMHRKTLAPIVVGISSGIFP